MNEMIVRPKPPTPRAPAVLERRCASEQTLIALKADIAVRALAASEGKPGGKEGLAALHQKIIAAEFEIDCKRRGSRISLWVPRQRGRGRLEVASIQAMPSEMIVAGISLTKCCQLCSPENGCVITAFGACGHPKLVGGLDPKHQGDPTVRGPFVAACRRLESGADQ